MAVTISSNPTTSLRLSILSIPTTSSTRNLQSLQTISCFNGGGGGSSSCSKLLAREQRKLGFWNGVSVRRKRLVVSCGVTEIDQSQFPETVLKSELPVLVEFIADWCGPCRLIAPAIDWASKEYEDRLKVVKINHDENPQLIEEYKVYGLPALIFFKNGKEVSGSRREGAMTKAKLKEYIDALLESASVA